MPLYASNFDSNSLSGIVRVTGGSANVRLVVQPFAFEGNKTFVLKLRKDSTLGTVIGISSPITITDNSTIISLVSNVSTVNEGNLVSFTLTTANVPNNSNVFFSVLPMTANLTAGDFTSNTGMFTIVNNTAVAALKANADVSLVDETGETFRLQLRTNSPTGNIVYVTSNVIVGDVSRFYNIVSFVESTGVVTDSGSITFTVVGSGVPAGTVFYYDTVGQANVTSASFSGGNTGSFVLNTGSNTFTMTPTAGSVLSGGRTSFAVRVKDFIGPSSTTFATSNTISFISADAAYISATGGQQVIDSGGIRTHIFTSSANLVVTTLGAISAYNNVEYFTVAGGGGGGGGSSTNSLGGGGGGAGGWANGVSSVAVTGNITIIVGGGGGGGPNGNSQGVNGSNTILSGGINFIAVGGGFGAANQDINQPGGNGGSGGGSVYSQNSFGQGYPGQGFPGGTFGNPVRAGGSGGGAGAASGMNNPGGGVNAPGGVGKPYVYSPASYGTPGPVPGQYFGGGGGGGESPAQTGGIRTGGSGGGGAGSPSGGSATLGSPNTGGGGGGGNSTNVGGAGGSGIAMIRYPYGAKIFNNVTANSYNILQGAATRFDIATLYASGATLYYTLSGNIQSFNLVSGQLSGSFVATGDASNIYIQTNSAGIAFNDTKAMQLQLRTDSTSGAIVFTSNTVYVENPSGIGATSTAGNVITDSGFITHVFTSPGTFTVTKVPAAPSSAILELLVVGGGGASMAPGNNPQSTAGAGAGGYIARSNTASITTYTVIVGSGGNNGAAQNSSFSGGSGSANITYIARGGGFGGGVQNISRDGGSGGAADGNGGGPGAGYNYPGPDQQGYPAAVPNNPGAGGAGAVGSGNNGGVGLVAPMSPSLGTSYGTTGPGPGRYFAGGGGTTSGGAGGGGSSGVAGVTNTGGGAGAGAPGVGGSGIVIIRYPR
jgi:hypothetical protein